MRVVAYLRVSSRTQARDDKYGLDTQRADVKRYCREAGHRVVRWEVDPGLSGTLPDQERPALLASLKAIRDGEAEALVIPSLNRLARLLHVQEAILAKVWQMGGSVYSAEIHGEVLRDDPDDPMRTAMRQMVGVFAQLDRAMILKRMANGKAAKQAKGGYVHGAPGFGRRAQDGQLVPDPAEAETVARIIGMAAGGLGVRGIAAILNGDGIPTKRGTIWHPETVARVLRREGKA
jgi:DNA invertase Pin-like site-specific DNA recombinase